MEVEKIISDSWKIIGMLNSVIWSRKVIEKNKKNHLQQPDRKCLAVSSRDFDWQVYKWKRKKKYFLQKWISGDDQQEHHDRNEKLMLKEEQPKAVMICSVKISTFFQIMYLVKHIFTNVLLTYVYMTALSIILLLFSIHINLLLYFFSQIDIVLFLFS